VWLGNEQGVRADSGRFGNGVSGFEREFLRLVNERED